MIDEKSGAQVTISCIEHSVHEGEAYMLSLSSALDAFDIDAPLSFLFTTPNTPIRCHMYVHGSANTAAIIQVYEDTGVATEFDVTGGTSITPKNRNRNSSNVATAIATHTPSITKAEAVALLHSKYAAKSGIEESFPVLLKQNTKYLFRFLSSANDNEGSLNLSWCEKADRAFAGVVGSVE